MKKNVKASKKYKINFGPQCSQKSEHLVIIRTAGGTHFWDTSRNPRYHSNWSWYFRRSYSFSFPILPVFKKKNTRKNVNKRNALGL